VHIDKTTQLACAVRSTALPGDPVVALASKQYVVVQRNADLKGPATIAPAPRNTPSPVAKRTVKAASIVERPVQPVGGAERFDRRKPHRPTTRDGRRRGGRAGGPGHLNCWPPGLVPL
jgi:hypothetical protein